MTFASDFRTIERVELKGDSVVRHLACGHAQRIAKSQLRAEEWEREQRDRFWKPLQDQIEYAKSVGGIET